jgi:hypothetical protein
VSERAEEAWAELRRGQEIRSLALLRKRAGVPLVTVRCGSDGTLSAAAWRTSLGPLLVTGHRPTTTNGRTVKGTAGAGTFLWGISTWGGDARWAGGRAWTPRLVLLSEDPADAFPLPCPDCEAPLPYTAEQLAADAFGALVSGPVVREV